MASKKKRSISCATSVKDGESDHYGYGQEMYSGGVHGDHERGPLIEDDDDDDYYFDHVQEYETHPTFTVRRDHTDAHNRLFGTVWCVHDICGIICAVFTWLLVMYAEFVVMRVILFSSTSSSVWYRNLNAVVWQSLAGLALVSHVRAMFTDPGAVERGTATKEIIELMGFRKGQVIYKCQKCCSIKPRRAHHCSVCQRCIKKMDHHCPWVNNCVGENNQKFFVLFTFYIALTSIHALILAINHFVICVRNEWKECTAFTPPATVVFLVFLIFEALLFTIFTVIMFATQLQAIWHDETGIEQLKKEETKWTRRSRWMSLQVVFGRFSVLGWFNPFTSPTASTRKPHFISFPV